MHGFMKGLLVEHLVFAHALERRLDRALGGEIDADAFGGRRRHARSGTVEADQGIRPASLLISAEPMNPLLPVMMTTSCAGMTVLSS